MNIGTAFGDSIKTEKFSRRKYSNNPRYTPKGYFLLFLIFITASLFIWRLAHLQLVEGNYYRGLSDSNRIRTEPIYAPRGIIFDRNGVPLVLNVPGFRQTIPSKCLPDNLDSQQQIEQSEKKECEELKDSAGIPLKKEQALQALAQGQKNIAIDSLREYPFKDVLTHVLGYIGAISEDELKNKDPEIYTANDWVGKSGIELEYEELLRGKNGKKLIEVDAMGQEIRSLGQTDPISGRDITLTIDSRIQKSAFDASKDIKKGAVIVASPKGEILAFVSKPSFDPNLFTLQSTYSRATDSAYRNVNAVLNDTENLPLLNRAIEGVYPPGSTFKLVVAAAGLEKKIIDENFSINDTGVIKVGEFSFANWYFTQYGRTEGKVDVVKAIARSNDIYFYRVAEKIKADTIAEEAAKFGVGAVSGIDLPGERKGVLPTQKWKEENLKESWFLGNTYHYGIGQGFLLTTPLQVNLWTQVLANGGTLYKPRLLKTNEAIVKTDNIVSDKTLSLIRRGMIDSCKPGGVAWPLYNLKVRNAALEIDGRNFLEVKTGSVSASLKETKEYREIVVACKTGTSQHGDDETLPHAWITLFAPAYDPEIVITVLNESSGEGSNEAAPVAKEILSDYFSGAE